MVGIQQWLTITRIEYVEILLQELAHNLRSGAIAQERSLSRRQHGGLIHIEVRLWRQCFSILDCQLGLRIE